MPASLADVDPRCAHERDGIEVSVEVADYQPLTLAEVTELLELALPLKQGAPSAARVQGLARIQCRLVRGISGMTCPSPIDGDVAQRMTDLESAYVYELGSIPVSELAGKLYALMVG
jgi:hypothetical protein